MKKFMIIVLLAFTQVGGLFGQEKNKTNTFIGREFISRYVNIAAGSDILTDNDNGNLDIEFTPFLIIKAFKPGVNLDRVYLSKKMRRRRNLNLGFSVPTSFDGNKGKSSAYSLSYNLVNKRDITEQAFVDANTLGTMHNNIMMAVQIEYLNTLEPEKRNEASLQLDSIIKDPDRRGDWDNYGAPVKHIFRQTLKQFKANRSYEDFGVSEEVFDQYYTNNDAISFDQLLDTSWKNFKERVSRRSLLKATASAERLNGWNNLNLELTYLKGLTKNVEKKPWDFSAMARMTWEVDSTRETSNVNQRQVALAELGINKVLLEKGTEHKSVLEFKLATEYRNVIQGAYVDEDHSQFNLMASLTPRIGKDVFFPVTLKYDPASCNFLGLFSLVWSFADDNR